MIESTGTAQTGGSGLAGCSRWGEAGVLRLIRGTGIVQYAASAYDGCGDAGLMLQTVDSVVGDDSCVPRWKLPVNNYTDLKGVGRCWRVN